MRPPRAAGINDAVEPLRPLRRQRHERLHVGIATDHPVERDDARRFDLRRPFDEVAVMMVDTIRMALQMSKSVMLASHPHADLKRFEEVLGDAVAWGYARGADAHGVIR